MKIDKICRYMSYIVIGSIISIMIACGSNSPSDIKIKELTKEIDGKYKNVDAICLRGNEYFDRKEYQKAIDDYDMALAIDPELTKVYLGKGSAYIEMGEYDKAIEVFNKILETKKSDISFFLLYERRGFALYKKGLYDQALEDYNRSIEIEPDYFIAAKNKRMVENAIKNR
jgi:tetratricopeptide (TPR) repeat protein